MKVNYASQPWAWHATFFSSLVLFWGESPHVGFCSYDMCRAEFAILLLLFDLEAVPTLSHIGMLPIMTCRSAYNSLKLRFDPSFLLLPYLGKCVENGAHMAARSCCMEQPSSRCVCWLRSDCGRTRTYRVPTTENKVRKMAWTYIRSPEEMPSLYEQNSLFHIGIVVYWMYSTVTPSGDNFMRN